MPSDKTDVQQPPPPTPENPHVQPPVVAADGSYTDHCGRKIDGRGKLVGTAPVRVPAQPVPANFVNRVQTGDSRARRPVDCRIHAPVDSRTGGKT
jgi:hypothetical protein